MNAAVENVKVLLNSTCTDVRRQNSRSFGEKKSVWHILIPTLAGSRKVADFLDYIMIKQKGLLFNIVKIHSQFSNKG